MEYVECVLDDHVEWVWSEAIMSNNTNGWAAERLRGPAQLPRL